MSLQFKDLIKIWIYFLKYVLRVVRNKMLNINVDIGVIKMASEVDMCTTLSEDPEFDAHYPHKGC